MTLNLKPGRPGGAHSLRVLNPVLFVFSAPGRRDPGASNRDKEPLSALSTELRFNTAAETLRVAAFQYRILCDFCLFV